MDRRSEEVMKGSFVIVENLCSSSTETNTHEKISWNLKKKKKNRMTMLKNRVLRA